ncbi:hypothetical protein [Shimia sp.]|uniref:hypothetical protein n=1 Tax=Shimia sp. TaxID=1954381 RepID=UPI00329A7993
MLSDGKLTPAQCHHERCIAMAQWDGIGHLPRGAFTVFEDLSLQDQLGERAGRDAMAEKLRCPRVYP